MTYINNDEDIEEIIRIRKLIFKVVRFIRTNDNYEEAASILIENKITVTEVIKYTLRLSLFDIAKLSDQMLLMK